MPDTSHHTLCRRDTDHRREIRLWIFVPVDRHKEPAGAHPGTRKGR
ncbi:MAG: hypothetical protein MZV64_23130 [Ignavibacteriales bacterium]|nr:hypothetical protein [Ignavibacteriales bacterium]